MPNVKTLPTNGGLMNPRWTYVNKDATDIRKTFERAAAQQLPHTFRSRINAIAKVAR